MIVLRKFKQNKSENFTKVWNFQLRWFI